MQQMRQASPLPRHNERPEKTKTGQGNKNAKQKQRKNRASLGRFTVWRAALTAFLTYRLA
jgi:hypothetical protein